MASVSLSSNSYDGRYYKFTVTQSGTSTTVSWKFEVLGGSDNYYTASPINCTINGHSVYSKDTITDYTTHAFPAAKGSKEGTYNIGSYGSFKVVLSGRPYYHTATTEEKTLTLEKPTYTISYNANGSNVSGVPSNQTKTYGTALKLDTKIPTRTGYTFSKWNTKEDGSGTSYNAGANYTANSAVALYAIWTENIFTVNYYSNYATYGAYQGSALNVTSNTNIKVAENQFLYDDSYTNGLSNVQNTSYLYLSRIGYTPTGYWGTSTSGGTLVNEATSYTGESLAKAFGKTIANGNDSINVYPQWNKNVYKFNYDSNGGSGYISQQSVEWLSTFTLSDNVFKREGYKFVGWHARRDKDMTWYVPNVGWLTDDEIIANGYTKRLYENHVELIFGDSWVSGDEYSISEYTMFAVWEISGVVYIDNGTSFEPYLAYIDNGTDWELYLMYVDDGENWNIIS